MKEGGMKTCKKKTMMNKNLKYQYSGFEKGENYEEDEEWDEDELSFKHKSWAKILKVKIEWKIIYVKSARQQPLSTLKNKELKEELEQHGNVESDLKVKDINPK